MQGERTPFSFASDSDITRRMLAKIFKRTAAWTLRLVGYWSLGTVILLFVLLMTLPVLVYLEARESHLLQSTRTVDSTFVKKILTTTVEIESEGGMGRGIWDERSGILLTNHHVFVALVTPDATGKAIALSIKRLAIPNQKSKTENYKLLACSRWLDYCALQMVGRTGQLPPEGAALFLNSPLVALPRKEYSPKFGNELATGEVLEVTEARLMTTLPIAHGYSGSPLFAIDGSIAGMASAMRSKYLLVNLMGLITGPSTSTETLGSISLVIPYKTIRQDLECRMANDPGRCLEQSLALVVDLVERSLFFTESQQPISDTLDEFFLEFDSELARSSETIATKRLRALRSAVADEAFAYTSPEITKLLKDGPSFKAFLIMMAYHERILTTALNKTARWTNFSRRLERTLDLIPWDFRYEYLVTEMRGLAKERLTGSR